MTSPNQPSTAAAQGFTCPGCGAALTWNAAAGAMTCDHCGQKQAVAVDGRANIRSIPIEEGMRLAQRGLGTAVQTVGCKDCGATVNVGEGERTTKCAFCGSAQVLAQATDANSIRPESLVPFGVTKQVANERFGLWLKSLWFRPNDLTRMGKVEEMGGVYVPYWSFDSAVQSQWSAERGWNYQETETYEETDANGNRAMQTRQVQKTRWEPASGYRQDQYFGVLVCAGKGLPETLAAKFVSFDVAQLVPYQPQFLAGWRAESYTLDLMPGWQRGQGIIASSQETRCMKDIGGDTSRGLTVANDYQQVAFKHVLLPVWIAAYRYNGKVYRFLVNGQTGEIVGDAPWSVAKIALFVLFILAIIGGIVAATQMNRSHAPARSASAPAATATQAAPARPAPARHGNH
jgi:Zn finger protein HypA/HybF involved in hydrogenase expression